jgi:hypothetical protein
MIQLCLELAYCLLFIVLPVALIVYLRRTRRITSAMRLLCLCGILIGVGFASWRLLFGNFFLVSSEVFFLINLPLGAMVSIFSSRLEPSQAEVMEIAVPMIFYPCLGLAVGWAIDQRRK